MSGWCNYRPGSRYSNVRLKPVSLSGYAFAAARKLLYGPFLMTKRWTDHWVTEAKIRSFAPISEVERQERLFRIYFTGNTFIGMAREMWLRYPLETPATAIGTEGVSGADQTLSFRLNHDGVPMLCARGAFFYHLKSMRNFIVGKVRPEVRFDC